ncbi:hypothetical protein C8Q80DRAFT_822132 [Daedaleopsis nitida]|nr:hypothetical protein C8Q80DRAFT_822132 [Daedaleopsis nitida]
MRRAPIDTAETRLLLSVGRQRLACRSSLAWDTSTSHTCVRLRTAPIAPDGAKAQDKCCICICILTLSYPPPCHPRAPLSQPYYHYASNSYADGNAPGVPERSLPRCAPNSIDVSALNFHLAAALPCGPCAPRACGGPTPCPSFRRASVGVQRHQASVPLPEGAPRHLFFDNDNGNQCLRAPARPTAGRPIAAPAPLTVRN